MKRLPNPSLYILLSLFLCAGLRSLAQTGLPRAALPQNTPGQTALTQDTSAPFFQSVRELMESHPWYPFGGEALVMPMDERRVESDDLLFYYMMGLLLFLALIRLAFPWYMSAMTALFFRATMRRQQLRDQMHQAPLPAWLLNLFFVLSGATLIAFADTVYPVPFGEGFWNTLFLAAAGIAWIYLGKTLVLTAAGWIFGIRKAASAYLFVVFLALRMTGVLLIPLLWLIAFADPRWQETLIIVALALVAALFAYRFTISYKPLHEEIKLSRLHFFLYLCAFEIAPLLLIYKVLLTYEDSSS